MCRARLDPPRTSPAWSCCARHTAAWGTRSWLRRTTQTETAAARPRPSPRRQVGGGGSAAAVRVCSSLNCRNLGGRTARGFRALCSQGICQGGRWVQGHRGHGYCQRSRWAESGRLLPCLARAVSAAKSRCRCPAAAAAADVDPECEEARDGLKLAGEDLTKEQLEQAGGFYCFCFQRLYSTGMFF